MEDFVMETKIKWNDGDGYITAVYDGFGNGPVSISSDMNNGGKRSQYITVETLDGAKSLPVLVVQSGGNVESYTRLAYIECTGEQYIDLDYIVKEDDVIEMEYISTSSKNADRMLFGVVEGGSGLWCSLYGNDAYLRYGFGSSAKFASAGLNYRMSMFKGGCTFGDGSGTLSYGRMPNNTMYLFAGNDDNSAWALGYCRCSRFKISDINGNVMELIPHKRNSDGKVGMLDVVSGKFLINSGQATDFLHGSEIKLQGGYELISHVSINADKYFEACVIESDYTIEVMWAKASASGSMYLYGVITSPHTKSVTAYLGSSASWRWGSASASFATNNVKDHYAVVSNGSIEIDKTSKTFTKQTFVTENTLVVGGYRTAQGVPNYQYAGKIMFFRVKDANGNYVLDLAPCKNADGVEGFWDCVSQSFFRPL